MNWIEFYCKLQSIGFIVFATIGVITLLIYIGILIHGAIKNKKTRNG